MDGHQVLTPARDPRRSSLRAFLLGALPGAVVILVLLALWLRFRRGDPALAGGERAPPVASTTPAVEGAPMPATPRPTLVTAREESPPPPPPAVDSGAAATGADAGAEELKHPHPITDRHLRIYRENNLLGELDGAMDVKDGAGLRHLLQQYRSEFPEDPNQLQEGYGIIADCLEHPGSASTAAAHIYFDRERGSTLRRFVARHCFGEP